MSRQPRDKSKLWALAATLLFHAALVAALVMAFLEYRPGQELERTWPPVDDDEILYGGEYVMLGDNPLATSSDDQGEVSPAADESAVEASDLDNAGAAQPAPAPLASANTPSPVKVKPQPPVKAGPSKEEIERENKARQEKETAEKISNRVNFGSTGTDNSSNAKAGSKNGNTSTGALSGAPGTDLKGRSLASWSKPSGSATGTIVVQVHVNRKGRVTRAVYISGTGAVAGNAAARQSCEQAALKSTFSVADDGPAEQVGRITYRFE